MVKLVNTLVETADTALYAGQSNASNEMFLRPTPKTDESGAPLRAAQRYYVFRLLFFTTDERKYPFIVRNEHEFFKKDASGKVIAVKRICCPTTLWAKSKIHEKVDQNYCPICKYSMKQNADGFRDFKTLKQIDKVCLDMARETQKKWAAYLPVYVVSDPNYDRNNKHFRVLRLSGAEGQAAFARIRELIKTAQENKVSVFNGDEGANIGILCEKQTKLSFDKKGEPILDKQTGEQKTYVANVIADVKLLQKNLHSYPQITATELEKLRFDEIYGSVSTKEELQQFLNENYLCDISSADDEFADDEFTSTDEVQTASATAKTVAENDDDADEFDGEDTAENDSAEDADEPKSAPSDDEFTKDDLEDDGEESNVQMIQRLASKKSAAAKPVPANVKQTITLKKSAEAELPDDADELRQKTLDADMDDMPF